MANHYDPFTDRYVAVSAGGEKRKDVLLRTQPDPDRMGYGAPGYVCKSIADLPKVIKSAVGMTNEEGKPMVCGGVGVGKHWLGSNQCYVYQKESDSWVKGPTMLERRTGAAAVTIPNGDTWVFGGRK